MILTPAVLFWAPQLPTTTHPLDTNIYIRNTLVPLSSTYISWQVHPCKRCAPLSPSHQSIQALATPFTQACIMPGNHAVSIKVSSRCSMHFECKTSVVEKKTLHLPNRKHVHIKTQQALQTCLLCCVCARNILYLRLVAFPKTHVPLSLLSTLKGPGIWASASAFFT